MKKKKPMSFKITDAQNNVKYLRIHENGSIQLVNKDLTSFTLSNVTDNAAELSFALQSATTLYTAAKVVRKHVYSHMKVEVI